MYEHIKLQKWYVFFLALQDPTINRHHTKIKPSVLPNRKFINEMKKVFLTKLIVNEITSMLKNIPGGQKKYSRI